MPENKKPNRMAGHNQASPHENPWVCFVEYLMCEFS